jgi:hypothetical protein
MKVEIVAVLKNTLAISWDRLLHVVDVLEGMEASW